MTFKCFIMKNSDVKRLFNHSSKEEKTKILLKMDKIQFLSYLYEQYEINKEIIMFIFTFLSKSGIIYFLNNLITNRNILLFCLSHNELLKQNNLKPKITYHIEKFNTLNDVSIQNTKHVYFCESCYIIITKYQNMNILHFLNDHNHYTPNILKLCLKKTINLTFLEFIKSMFKYVFDYRFLIFTCDYRNNNYLIRRLNNIYDLNIIVKNNYDDIEEIERRVQRRISALIAFRDLHFNNHISRVLNNLHLKIEIVTFL